MQHICFFLIQQIDVLIQNRLYENDKPDDCEPRSESEDAPDVAQDCHRQCQRRHQRDPWYEVKQLWVSQH